MSIPVRMLIVALFVAGYVIAPTLLVWGWIRWTLRPKPRTVSSFLSLVGFIFATASALLAICTVSYAQVHIFRFYDPQLLKIFLWGILLSLAGILFGISGLLRQNSLRWHAPISAMATLAFWVMAASME